MSNKTLLGAAMPNIYYNAISAEPIATEPVTESVSVHEQARIDMDNRIKERQLKRQKEQEYRCCMIMFACPFIILLILAVIYLIFIIGAIICVSINQCMEYVIVGLFGRAVYNKNFPVCTSTIYTGNNCYASTNTYCL
jgi:hypothetical protein